MTDTPLVSILCLTYNHEKQIRRTLDAFVMQKTDFPFEVLIHEDASTDGTAAVIREYEARYPDIIRPVYQTENQYSKPDTPIIKTFLLPLVRGKYVVLCDGDDPFTDPFKLQKQADFLEAHPKYSLCAHRAVNHVEGTPDAEDTLYPAEDKARDYNADDIIRRGAGLFATNSFMLRTDVYTSMPECFFVSGVGDYNTLMHAAICGPVHYLPDVMSVHNDGVPGSWTSTVWNQFGKRIEHEEIIIDMLKRVDAHYEGRFHDAAADAIAMREGEIRVLRRLMRREKLRRALPWLVNIKRRLMGQSAYQKENGHD